MKKLRKASWRVKGAWHLLRGKPTIANCNFITRIPGQLAPLQAEIYIVECKAVHLDGPA